jgi:hypothetical protein
MGRQTPSHGSFGELLGSAVAIFALKTKRFVQSRVLLWASAGASGSQILKMEPNFFFIWQTKAPTLLLAINRHGLPQSVQAPPSQFPPLVSARHGSLKDNAKVHHH